LLGGLTLIVSVSFDVDVMLEQRSAEVGWRGEWLEIAEHVVLPLVVLMTPMFVAARWVIRKSLAPLSAAAERIDSAEGTERGFRLILDDLPLEAMPFARAVNNLLKRLDDVAERREAFAANAAHELKTPLAILTLELERLGSTGALRLKNDVAAMNRLVDQLILMAQVEAKVAAPNPRNLVSLEKVVTDVAMRLAPLASAQNKNVELEIEGHALVVGTEETLAAAVRNLAENGLRVTPAGGAVIISAGPGARIGVRDGGPGLSATELAIFSQRFVRADDTDKGGAGLGLAIVARIVEIHQAELATNPDRREIYLSFPNAEQLL
jgi:signal transduction histidine kinase